MSTCREPVRTLDVVPTGGTTESIAEITTKHDAPLMTAEQAAALLAVPTSWLKQRVASHAIACTRLGRHIRFTREQVAAIVTASEQPAAMVPLTGLTRRSRRPA